MLLGQGWGGKGRASVLSSELGTFRNIYSKYLFFYSPIIPVSLVLPLSPTYFLSLSDRTRTLTLASLAVSKSERWKERD